MYMKKYCSGAVEMRVYKKPFDESCKSDNDCMTDSCKSTTCVSINGIDNKERILYTEGAYIIVLLVVVSRLFI
jgi:hypothetical protein